MDSKTAMSKSLLVSIVLLPMLALVLTGGGLVWQHWAKSRHMDSINRLVQLSVKVSALVHELQKERGLSVVVVSSGGKRMTGELEQQRRMTDAVVGELADAQAVVKDEGFDQRGLDHMARVRQELDRLPLIRQGVQNLTLRADDVLGFFNALNRLLVDLIHRVQLYAGQGEVVNEMSAYVNFLLLKELAGRERALLGAVFAKNQFESGQFEQLVALTSTQAAKVQMLETLLPDSFATRLREILADPAAREAEALRRLALNKAAEGNFDVDPAVWFRAQTSKIDLLKDFENALTASLLSDIRQLSTAALSELWMTLMIGLVAQITIAWVGFGNVRRILNALGRDPEALTEFARSISQGELRARAGEGENATGAYGALVDMKHKLARVLVELRVSSRVLGSHAQRIANDTQALSARVAEEGGNLEKTASSMEEMTAIVKHNADNAVQANQLAAAAKHEAEQGSGVLGRAIEAMERISRTSQQMSEIIAVIDDIAFQTNLLALNAAVEAAHADEQGKGFAVVASEVRNLAKRSSDAAREIRDLIQTSVRMVNDGTELVNQSGRSLSEITTAVNQVTMIISEIASANKEQAAGIEHVNQAMSHLDQMFSQSVDLSERTARASEQMLKQAAQVERLLQFFRLELPAKATAPAPRLPAPSAQARSPMRNDSKSVWKDISRAA